MTNSKSNVKIKGQFAAKCPVLSAKAAATKMIVLTSEFYSRTHSIDVIPSMPLGILVNKCQVQGDSRFKYFDNRAKITKTLVFHHISHYLPLM